MGLSKKNIVHRSLHGDGKGGIAGEPDYLETLQKSRVWRDFRKAFADLAGVKVELHPVDGESEESLPRRRRTELCAPARCPICLKNHAVRFRPRKGAVRGRVVRCQAGLSAVLVPLKVHGRHVGTVGWGWAATDGGGRRRRGEGRGRASPAFHGPQWRGGRKVLELAVKHLEDALPRLFLGTHTEEHPAVAKIRELIRNDPARHARTADLAKQAGVSVFHLCRKFKEATGMTVTRYANLCRVERARTLLEDPEKRITDVASEAGFESISHFDRVFRSFVGTSPHAYRGTGGTRATSPRGRRSR